MDVKMIQHPVGQGGLFCGSLTVGRTKFRWVYDCGSLNRQERDREIIKVSKGGNIDILFLSHLDSDHVNGVHKLLQECRSRGFYVKKVVMPYIDVKTRLVYLSHYLVQGAVDPVFVAFSRGIGRWFFSFGVSQVIQVRSVRAGEESREVDEEETGDDGWFRDYEGDIDGRDGRDGEGEHERGEDLDLVFTSKGEEIHLEGYIAKINNDVQIELRLSKPRRIFYLVPYSHPPDSRRMKFFWAKMRSYFGSRQIGHIINSSSSVNIFGLFKSCYNVIWKDHNLVSLSLFCGSKVNRSSAFTIQGNNFKKRTPRGGWMLTGDAKLSGKLRIGRFLSHYRSYIPHVSVLMMPHHGADSSFHPSLLSPFNGHHMCYAAAEPPPNRYNHPGQMVRNAVRRNNKYFRTVGTALKSRLQLRGKI